MRHDLYAHVEMELFVRAGDITRAVAFVEWTLRWCGGEAPPVPASLAEDGIDVSDELAALRGRYVHDHAITVRRVLRDDTLISMTAGTDNAWYAISLITYQQDPTTFLEVCRFLARTMATAYRARPHWGKVCPLDGHEIAALYSSLPQFRACCRQVDPAGVFVNGFAKRVFDL
jgi:FAD/FMN-containing dehydrogenase